jgi:hypothetical protein
MHQRAAEPGTLVEQGTSSLAPAHLDGQADVRLRRRSRQEHFVFPDRKCILLVGPVLQKHWAWSLGWRFAIIPR